MFSSTKGFTMNKFILLKCFFLIISFNTLAEQAYISGSAPWAQQKNLERAEHYNKLTLALNKSILKYLDSYESEIFTKQMESWEQYSENTCAAVAFSSGTTGSRWKVYNAMCQKGLNYNRYFSTKNALKCIERINNQKYSEPGVKSRCLLQTFNIKVY